MTHDPDDNVKVASSPPVNEMYLHPLQLRTSSWKRWPDVVRLVTRTSSCPGPVTCYCTAAPGLGQPNVHVQAQIHAVLRTTIAR